MDSLNKRELGAQDLGAQEFGAEVEIAERPRRVPQTKGMIVEFERLAAELNRAVQIEEERTGIHDPQNFAYSTVAKAAAQRRDNLISSVAMLRKALEAAAAARAAASGQSGDASADEPTASFATQPKHADTAT